MNAARQILERLKEGNRRYVAGETAAATNADRRAEVAMAQQPVAIVLGCSDSRVPVETVFDQGIGDLFVIRVAGNVAAPAGIGSIEFAAESFGVPLVVVLGHSRCGAVVSTLQELRQQAHIRSPNLRAIVDRVRPAVEPLLASERDEDLLLEAAIRANVDASVAQLPRESEVLERLVASHELMIVGAQYCLDTGAVEFFDVSPDV